MARRKRAIPRDGSESTSDAANAEAPDVEKFYEALADVGERYFRVWPQQRDEILAWHERNGQQICKSFKFADVDELGRWYDKMAAVDVDGTNLSDINADLLRRAEFQIPATGDPTGVDKKFPFVWVSSWIAAQRGLSGGIFGPYLTFPTISIMTPRELATLRSKGDEAFKALPPVVIRPISGRTRENLKRFHPKDFVVEIVSAQNGLTADVLPEVLASEFESLIRRFSDVAGLPVSVGIEGDDFRATYHAFANAFWKWHTGRQSVDRSRPTTSPMLDDDLAISSSIIERAVLGGIYDAATPGVNWTLSKLGFARYKHVEKKGEVELSIRSDDSAPSLAQQAFEELKQLDDLTCDVFLLHVAHWRDNHDERGGCWLTAEAILRERNIKPKTRQEGSKVYATGYRAEDVEEIYSRVQQLERFWLTVSRKEVYVRSSKGQKQPKLLNRQGRALVVKERITQSRLDETDERVQAWYYQLYDGLEDLLDGNFGYIARKVLAYDFVRRVPEKRIGRYLAFHFRINSPTSSKTITRDVATVLDGCRIECDSARPQRTRDRVEEALNRLVADGCLSDWNYKTSRGATKTPKLQPRKWLDSWRELSLELCPPVRASALAGSDAQALASGDRPR